MASSTREEVVQDLFNEEAELECALWRADPVRAFDIWQRRRLIGVNQRSSLDERSTRQYAAMFGRVCRWLGENDSHIVAVRPEELERFLGSIGGRGAAAADSTVRRYLALVEKVIDHLNDIGVRVDRTQGGSLDNPARDLLRLPRYRYKEPPAPVFLSQSKSERYIEWVREQPVEGWVDVRDKALRMVFLACGVTVDEVRRMRVSDAIVTDDEGEVTQLQIVGHHAGQTARVVPVAAWAWGGITRWFRLRKAMFLESDAFFLARSSDFKLAEPGLDAMSATEVFTIIQEAMVAIGHTGQRQGPQTLRHTFTVRQLLMDVPKERIAEWLGLQTTEAVTAVARQLPRRGGYSPG